MRKKIKTAEVEVNGAVYKGKNAKKAKNLAARIKAFEDFRGNILLTPKSEIVTTNPVQSITN